MTARFFWRQLWRESRGSWRRFTFFVACLAIGVGAVVAVAGLGAEIRRIIRTEARQLLAADLALSGRQPPPTELDDYLSAHPDYERASIRELVAMSAARGTGDRAGRSQLVELKVVDGNYPFYGNLELRPEGTLADLLDAETAVVAPDLLQRLGLQIGDEILVGGHPFTISAVVEKEPDRMDGMFTLGPRVILSAEGVDRAGLIQYGSRVLYKELFKLPAELEPDQIQAAAKDLEAALPTAGLYQVESYVDAQPSLRRGLRRVERFLGTRRSDVPAHRRRGHRPDRSRLAGQPNRCNRHPAMHRTATQRGRRALPRPDPDPRPDRQHRRGGDRARRRVAGSPVPLRPDAGAGDPTVAHVGCGPRPGARRRRRHPLQPSTAVLDPQDPAGEGVSS